MTKILVTNDDGYDAPGIFALVEAMRELGDVEVAAPAINQSASGHKKTLYHDIPVARKELRDGTEVHAISASPADCIALSALGLLPSWPHNIVVSGINRGANMGQDVTYSGTVTAALEATIHGIPAVAVSLDDGLANSVEEYREAARIAKIVVKRVLEKSLPPLTILNLNIPKVERVKGLRLVRQGIRVYADELAVNEDRTVYQIVGSAPGGKVDEEGTDLWAVHQGYAALTPIHLDLTAHRFISDLAAWDIVVD